MILYRTGWLLCGTLMVVAAAFRLILLHTAFATVDGDQAVVGVMAYDVGAGAHPVFYYGQPYTGSLEAYGAALIFHLFGASDLTLRLPALAFSVIFVGLVFWLGALLYGYRIAVLSGLFLALGPAVLINWSTAAGANYVEVMVVGTALLLLAVRYPDLDVLPLPVALSAGLLAGVGVWIQPMIGEYLLPLSMAYVLRLFVTRRQGPFGLTIPIRTLAVMTMGLVVGSIPLILYNLRHPWATLSYLSHNGPGGDHLAVAMRMVTQSLPILLGLAPPTTEYDLHGDFERMTAAHPLPYAIGIVLGLYLLARFFLIPGGLPRRIAALWRGPGSSSHPVTRGDRNRETWSLEPIGWSRPETRPGAGERDGVPALFALSPLLFFVLSGFGAAYSSTTKPCYLLPLYTVTPLALDVLIPRRPGRRALTTATLAIAVLVTASLAMTASAPPRRSIDGLARLLEARHIRVVYANDYWIVYRIVFATHERVLGLGVSDTLRLGLVRIPGYLRVAAHTPANQIAWVFFDRRPAGERAFRRLLQRERVQTRRTAWGDRVIYDRLSRPLRASGPYFLHGQDRPVASN